MCWIYWLADHVMQCGLLYWSWKNYTGQHNIYNLLALAGLKIKQIVIQESHNLAWNKQKCFSFMGASFPNTWPYSFTPGPNRRHCPRPPIIGSRSSALTMKSPPLVFTWIPQLDVGCGMCKKCTRGGFGLVLDWEMSCSWRHQPVIMPFRPIMVGDYSLQDLFLTRR